MTQEGTTGEDLFAPDHRDVFRKAASLIEEPGRFLQGNWGVAYSRDENDEIIVTSERDWWQRCKKAIRDRLGKSTFRVVKTHDGKDTFGHPLSAHQVYESAKAGIVVDQMCALGSIEAAAGQLGADARTLAKAEVLAQQEAQRRFHTSVESFNDDVASDGATVAEFLRSLADQ